jgi:hypothetical protein
MCTVDKNRQREDKVMFFKKKLRGRQPDPCYYSLLPVCGKQFFHAVDCHIECIEICDTNQATGKQTTTTTANAKQKKQK